MKSSYLYSLVLVLSFVVLGLLLQAFQGNSNDTPSHISKQHIAPHVLISDDIQFAGEAVPVDIFYVREALEQELIVNTYWHSSTIQLLKRQARWFPFIDSMLRANNIPVDFKYLCVAESGLKNVVSPAGAAGFWQIMKDTGKSYGLEVNSDIDERYNLEKATKVACAYLQEAYDEFGSWTLAAASYNAGMNKIRKEIKRQSENDYYRMNFGTETARYLFRILALKQILSKPKAYGFFVKDVYEPLRYQSIKIDTTVHHLGNFSKELGISYRTLKYYNPWLRTSKLPDKSRKVYKINIPYVN